VPRRAPISHSWPNGSMIRPTPGVFEKSGQAGWGEPDILGAIGAAAVPEHRHEGARVSEVKVTASAWVVVEPPSVHIAGFKAEDSAQAGWKLRAEASVADHLGEPVSGLSKTAWSVHVTDAVGNSYAPSFTISQVAASGQPVAGFYVLTIADLRTPLWISPTAFGITIDTTARGHKRELRGQVVVPIRVQGPTIFQGLTFIPI
jgi:hypothetical protein